MAWCAEPCGTRRRPNVPPMRRALKFVIVGGVIVVALVGFGIWYWFIRDSAPPPATLPDRPTVAATAGPDGSYSVQTADTTFAGFRIAEEFSGGLDHTAVVRSPAVTGSLTVSGST